MVCPMKFALNNCKDYSCSQQSCARYCTYPNGEGECAIHYLPGLFDGLDSIATQITNKWGDTWKRNILMNYLKEKL